MEYALRKLNGTVFRNIFHSAKIRVKADVSPDLQMDRDTTGAVFRTSRTPRGRGGASCQSSRRLSSVP